MDSISLSTSFEYYPPSSSDFADNFLNRKKTDLKRELKRKLKVTEQQNEQLEETIRLNAVEISELKKVIQTINSSMNSGDKNKQNANSKIIELSKKNRQLVAELECIKNKCNKLESKLEQKRKNSESDDILSSQKPKKETCCHWMVNIEQMEEQLNTTKQKLFDALNSNTELRNSLKLAQKCLQQEIGDNFNLHSLASGQTNWRGRAQQIMSLQNKITELKLRLEGSSLDSEELPRMQIRKIETNRRDCIDDLQNQLKELTETNEQQKLKIIALKARNKNLVDEAMNYKLKANTLMDQSCINDNSVAAINEKINIQKYQHEHVLKDLMDQINEFEKVRQNFETENSRMKLQLSTAESVLETKVKTIESLKETIAQRDDELKSICGDFLFSCKDFKKTEYLAILDYLEAEKNGLAKFNSEVNERLEAESEKVKSQFETISKQKIKIARLEAKIKEHQKEHDVVVEKKKRSQRITEYSNNLTSRLSISGMVFENSNYNLDGPLTPLSLNTQSVSIPNDPHQLQNQEAIEIENLKNKIEFLQEKVEFLEEKVKITLAERDHEMKLFNETLLNSKNIIVNMIKQFQGTVENEANVNTPIQQVNDSFESNRSRTDNVTNLLEQNNENSSTMNTIWMRK